MTGLRRSPTWTRAFQVALRRMKGGLLVTAALALVSLVATSAHAAAPPRCATAGLVIWIDTQGDAAAGSTTFNLKLTNQSGHACLVRGYPGVSAVDLAGRGLGSPASRTTSPIRSITIVSGGTVSAPLQITVAGNFPPAVCRPVAAAGLRVYPPGATASKVVPLPFQACSRTGPLFLHVKAVAGTGR